MRRWETRLATVVVVAGLLGAVGPAAVAAENHAPVAVDDPAIPGCNPTDAFGGAYPITEDPRTSYPGVPQDWTVVFGSCSPLANDTDADGDTLTLELVGSPSHGQAQWVPDGFLLYKPDPDWSTSWGDWFSDEVHYRVSDGQAWSNIASVRYWVAAINDPPTFAPGPDLVEAIVGDGTVTTQWATDVRPGPTNEAAQSVTFDLEVAFNGAPASMFAQAPAIDQDGVLTFTPGASPGLATVTVTAHDDGGLDDYGMPAGSFVAPDDTSDPVVFSIAVHPGPPAAPVASDDDVVVPEDAISIFDVVANDTDPNGDALSIAAVGPPAHGDAGRADVAGSVGYVPAPDYTGPDTFTYTVEDGTGRTDTATVNVTVTNVNDPPVAADDAALLVEGASLVIPVLANDTDVDGDELAASGLSQPAHGAVTIVPGGVRYTAAVSPAFTGTDTFTYEASDGHGATDAASVAVTVVPDTTAPTVGSLSRTLPKQIVGSSTIAVRLGWSGHDAGTGIASYELQERVGTGSWRGVTPASATATTVTRTLAIGSTYDYRVRATDGRGNVGAWAGWTAFAPKRAQESSGAVTWTGTWSRVLDTRYVGGAARRTSSSGRRATYAFTGRDIGWVTLRSVVGGRAQVRIDGTLVATVDLARSTTGYRRVLFAAHLATGGSHRIEIRPLGDGRVTVDAFLVLP